MNINTTEYEYRDYLNLKCKKNIRLIKTKK